MTIAVDDLIRLYALPRVTTVDGQDAAVIDRSGAAPRSILVQDLVRAGPSATTSTAGLLSASDKSKLDTLPSASDFTTALASKAATNLSNVPAGTVSTTLLADAAVINAKIADNSVTNGKLADVASGTFKGRTSAGSGDPEDMTSAQAAALLPVVVGATSGTSGTKGLVPAATAGQQDFYFRGSGVFAALALTATDLPAGTIIDRAFASYSTYASFTTQIPTDNTKPQNNEGTQVLSASITPKSATNRVRVRANAPVVSTNTQGTMVMALFRGAGVDAIQVAAFSLAGADSAGSIPLEYEDVPGSTSSQTYTVRLGYNVAATWYINGRTSQIFNGSTAATLVLEEIKA